ncbi:MAG: glucosamine-6-phosphate isomerase [Dehalococcoidia bacterium]
MRPVSNIAPQWWDYTTLDNKILEAAAKLTADDISGLGRDGFSVVLYDTLEEFYLAEAMEYIYAWQQAAEEEPAGICGPIGPTEQLPLVASLVNELELDLSHCHFWGMDEWVVNGKTVGVGFPLSFARTDMDLCFSKIRDDLMMPLENIHFPRTNTEDYVHSWGRVRCVIMQGGQGEVKHWAFNDPPRREGEWTGNPPPPEEFRKLGTRIVDLHPLTLIQNARTSASGMVHAMPNQAITVGPVETWKAEKVSIWHPGHHDNPFGMRLTTLMISEKIIDTSVPMSLLADHPNVQFNFYRGGIGSCQSEIR